MKRFTVIFISIVVVFVLAVSQAWAKYRWKFINVNPSGQIYQEYFVQELADKIKKTTNGEVEVTNYAAGELPYKGTDYLKIVQKGLIEMADIVGGFVYGEVPLLAMPDFPYMALTDEEITVYRKTIMPHILQELSKLGVVPITAGIYPARQIVSRKPIKTLEDLKDQKVRTAGGLQETYIKLWGAKPSFVVGSEIYHSAQRGIVDATMTAWLQIEQSKVYEVCPHGFKIHGPIMYRYICINKRAWEALSKENQNTIRNVVMDFEKFWERVVGQEQEEAALQRMLQRGHLKTIAELPLEERIKTRKGLVPVLKKYVDKNIGTKGNKVFTEALKALNLE